jgi:hypothetical protein
MTVGIGKNIIIAFALTAVQLKSGAGVGTSLAATSSVSFIL